MVEGIFYDFLISAINITEPLLFGMHIETISRLFDVHSMRRDQGSLESDGEKYSAQTYITQDSAK